MSDRQTDRPIDYGQSGMLNAASACTEERLNCADMVTYFMIKHSSAFLMLCLTIVFF